MILFSAAPLGAEDTPIRFDHSLWDQFLKKYVTEAGEVDYGAAKKDPSLLEGYLEKLKSFPRRSFDGWPREERAALFINAYNAGVVKSVLNSYPIKSVMNIPGGWDQSLVQIGRVSARPRPGQAVSKNPEAGWGEASRTHSLNQIYNFLRHSFRDEKILFALCQGARSSPRLAREAYQGPRLEGQLYLATRAFVNDETRNRIQPLAKKIILSRLFEWYGRDFFLNWGKFSEPVNWNPQEMALLSFLAHYLEDPKKIERLREGSYKIKYEVFDWELNEPQKA